MRIRLEKPIDFFEEILNMNKLNLKQLSGKLNLPYTNLKKYRRGNLTIPQDIFNKLSSLGAIKFNSFKMNILENTWGASKGGKNTVKNLTKKQLIKNLTYTRSFKKITRVKLKLNKFLCEFYGTLMGDGCISRFRDFEKIDRIQIVISGNKSLDSQYLRFLKEKLKEEYGLYSYYYEYKKENVCILSIKNKGLALDLVKLGFPIGLKYKKLKIPHKFLVLDWDYKKLIIRGLFDTDGSIYSRKDEGYKYPIVSIKSKSSVLLNQILKLLRDKGYPAYISGDNVAVRGNKNINRWFTDIGSSNPRNKLKYQYWLKNKVLPPKIL